MFVFRKKIEKQDLGEGILLQELGYGEFLNVLHWNMSDGSEVKWHVHKEEQFGYVIKGGFKMKIGDDEVELYEGDAYFVPPNVYHSFIAIGETEAIDVFTPRKYDLPWKK